ncbi:MAG: CxxC-x17-CxxC domain-containing protein [Chloroflexota bacterium]
MPPELVDHASGVRLPVCQDCGDAFQPGPPRRDRSLPPPQRCPTCRERRLAEPNAADAAMERDGADITAPRTIGIDGSPGRAWPARCSDCRRDIRLPFRAREDRPVYCRSCWEARNGR